MNRSSMRVFAVVEAAMCGLLGGTTFGPAQDSGLKKAAATVGAPETSDFDPDAGAFDRPVLDDLRTWTIVQMVPEGNAEESGGVQLCAFGDAARQGSDAGDLCELGKSADEPVLALVHGAPSGDVPAPSSVLVLSGLALLIPRRHRPGRRRGAWRS